MQIKNILLSVIAICFVTILPHTGILPNFLYSIPIFLFVWLYLKFYGESIADIGFRFKSFELKSLLIGTISAILILTFMQLIFFPVLEMVVQIEETNVGLYDFIKKSKWNYIFIVIMGWVVGGFYEEIVFHGFIFSRIEKMFEGKYATQLSFLITSVIFGMYHIQLGLFGAINALIVGAVYLGLFLYFKRNLWYAIICHGVYNSIVMTMIYLDYL